LTPVLEVSLAASPFIGDCVLSGPFPRSFRIAVFLRVYSLSGVRCPASHKLFELGEPKPEYHSLIISLFMLHVWFCSLF